MLKTVKITGSCRSVYSIRETAIARSNFEILCLEGNEFLRENGWKQKHNLQASDSSVTNFDATEFFPSKKSSLQPQSIPKSSTTSFHASEIFSL